MKISRLWCVAAATTLAFTTASASTVTPDEALARVMGSSTNRQLAPGSKYRLARSITVKDDAMAYVFERENGSGFIVTPADDRIVALIGYGDASLTDSRGNLAPGMEYWLEELGRQIEYSLNHENTETVKHIPREARAPIAPLVKTTWYQREPYNELCPPDTPPHHPVGCVALAMGQVMNYHQWPAHGTGSVAYKWSGEELSINYDDTYFQWDKMLDSYTESSPQESIDAVALLLKATGYSVKTNYTPTGSGAQSISIGPALGTYFGYDRSMRFLQRNNYSLTDWEDIIYNSLVTYGPVIYDGISGAGGHSFICDGYEGDGYFHFNWGWGGASNGYFLLDVLEPEHQGLGGADGGYGYGQDIIVDIRPDRSGTSVWSYEISSAEFCDIRLEKGSAADKICLYSWLTNKGPGPMPDASFGFAYKDLDDTDSKTVYEFNDSEGEITLGSGLNGYSMHVPGLPDGRYSVTPVCRSGDGKPTEILFPIFGSARTVLTIKGGSPTLESELLSFPKLSDCRFPGTLNKFNPVTVTGKLTNLNDVPYMCPISIVVFDSSMSMVMAKSAPRTYDMEAGESIDIDLTATVLGFERVPDGYYYVCVALFDFDLGLMPILSQMQRVMVTSTGGVESIADDEYAAPKAYDLTGREIRNPVPGSVYIQNGKKAIGK